MNRWWVIHDDAIREALVRVEEGDVTKEEAYAILLEHSTYHPEEEEEEEEAE